MSSASHTPSAVCEWTSFNNEAIAFLAVLKETAAVFSEYEVCLDMPTSEDTCLFLCDKHHFRYANQLTAAAGLPGLEFSVLKARLNALQVKTSCE